MDKIDAAHDLTADRSTATHSTPAEDLVPDDIGRDDAPRPVPHALARTLVLAGALAIISSLTFALLGLGRVVRPHHPLGWWAIALLAVAAEVMAFHIEFRRDLYTFTFSEVPLVLGLFLATPSQFIVGRLVGTLAVLTLKERMPLRKLTLNLASYAGECVTLLVVDRALGHPSEVQRPVTWISTVVAVFAADVLGFVVVARVIRWHGGPINLREIMKIGFVTAPVNTSLGLCTVILLRQAPWATPLLAGLAAFVLLSYRAYARLRQRFESLTMLYDFTRLVSGAQQPETVLQSILGQARTLMSAERAEIWLTDEQGHYLRLAVDDEGLSTTPMSADIAGLIARWFGDAADTTVITSAASDPRMRSMAAALHADDCIVAPITETGRVVGLVAVANRLGEMNGFRTAEGPMFATFANHASVALENGRLIVRLHEQARQREHESLHDSLTGLPNRVLFNERLTEALEAIEARSGSVAVALMDLDGFKEINDTLGHQAGDRTLVEVARRLERVIRPTMTVARLGGDEFALLIPDVTRRAELDAIGRRIRKTLAEPMRIDGVRINTGISVGIAISPMDGRDAAMLLQRADVAMYGAKSGLGDGVNFYDAECDANTPRRFALVNDLHGAIDAGEMSVVYQPKVRLRDGAAIGVEALVRWSHPRFGAVGPDEFIPLAERSGVIVQITEFVLGTALRQAAEWQRQGRNWSLAVNLSMRSLLDGDLVDSVERHLLESGVRPDRLTLEITETNVMSDTSRTIDVLERLARIGVRLAIDDFGTGYSSLSYLRRLPVHEVKIDKLFVQPMTTDRNAEAIVCSILDLARNMNLTAVAEGVEDRATWTQLRELGCEEAQGYYLSHPMAASDLPAWVDQLPRLRLSPRAVTSVARVNRARRERVGHDLTCIRRPRPA